MLGETGRQEVTPICGNGDFLAYGSPRITARYCMFHDKGKLTSPHLPPDAGHIKNSANVMHNGRAITKISQLPPCLLGGTWHPIYKELPCAGRNSYQQTSRYRLPPYTMREPSRLQLQRGKDFVKQQRRSMQQGQRERRWCTSL
jgi:hypothetical protein